MTDELEQLKADNARMKLALQSLMQTQGIIMRGDEYIPYRWAREAADMPIFKELEKTDVSPPDVLPEIEDVDVKQVIFPMCEYVAFCRFNGACRER